MLLGFKRDYRIGQGYDVHAIAEGLPMWLGGVKVESPRGFVAHSDGDVAIHALCDALLGALALGDIGHLFPDTDPQYKGIIAPCNLSVRPSLYASNSLFSAADAARCNFGSIVVLIYKPWLYKTSRPSLFNN